MAKQFLGDKKKRKIESILGQPIVSALVGGDNRTGGHFWAEVWTRNGECLHVNYKTGEIR